MSLSQYFGKHERFSVFLMVVLFFFMALIVKNVLIKNPSFIIWFFVLLFSLIPFFIWYLFGREKDFVVPEYLHTLPDSKLEPWKVDVLTNGTFKMSKNGVASVILELYLNNVLQVRMEKELFVLNRIIFFVRKKISNLDKLSNKAQDFYRMLKENVFKEDKNYFYCKPPDDNKELRIFLSKEVPLFVSMFYSYTGFYVLETVVFFLGYSLEPLLKFLIDQEEMGSFMFLFSLFALNILLLLNMKIVFNHLEGDNYKEYLEWLAFKRMLLDFAQIQEYFKEDYQHWKSWLLYATALGSAENLINAMKELNILSVDKLNDIADAQSAALAVAEGIIASPNLL